MNLPTEPLLFGVLLIFLLKCFSDRGFDREIIRHPVSVAIFISVTWMLVTTFTSTMPIVSIKFLLSRVWFIVGFYLLAAKLFDSGQNFEKYVWVYAIPLLIAIGYATNRHLSFGLWDKQAANYVVNPLYNDHTAYGAALAMYLPFFFSFSFSAIYSGKTRSIARIFLAVLFAGLILSYARAAWISMVAALGVWSILKLRIRFKPLFITSLACLAIVFVFERQILMYLERNNTESSTNLTEHISSVSNISSDASNLERINRWSCAIRMFEDKPIFGWGPGTYMFNYAPYQLTANRTIISTNSADGGNAHSEYLGPMAESGFMGLITFLILIATVIYTAVQTYTRAQDKRIKTIVMSALLGLTTYYVHGILNNFLDTDKLSVPFWGFTAMIVAADIFTKRTGNAEIQSKT
jgi:O-antigen ligase